MEISPKAKRVACEESSENARSAAAGGTKVQEDASKISAARDGDGAREETTGEDGARDDHLSIFSTFEICIA
jgi:hypothetical protein